MNWKNQATKVCKQSDVKLNEIACPLAFDSHLSFLFRNELGFWSLT